MAVLRGFIRREGLSARCLLCVKGPQIPRVLRFFQNTCAVLLPLVHAAARRWCRSLVMPETLKPVLILVGVVVALVLGILVGKHSRRVEERRKRSNERPPPSRLSETALAANRAYEARTRLEARLAAIDAIRREAGQDPDFRLSPMPDPAQLMRPLDEAMAQIQDRI